MAGEERRIKIEIKNVVKEYRGDHGTTVALNGVNLNILENEFVCVVGPSGCGKSTLLNVLAGLHEASSGECFLDGKRIEGTGVERGVVFQQYALFPWQTVIQNVMFGPQMKRLPKAECQEIARKEVSPGGGD
ncbi:MAG: ATP-binding cassette domain-containing protein [Oscillospiraceae bacterium]|nr:ATP-binding cassette domain-containing protein [Oscillospiraceae bacterium]